MTKNLIFSKSLPVPRQILHEIDLQIPAFSINFLNLTNIPLIIYKCNPIICLEWCSDIMIYQGVKEIKNWNLFVYLA